MAYPLTQVLVGAAGLALGAAIMYVMDPDQGRRRRALARDQAVKLGHATADLRTGPIRYYRLARGRAAGLIYRSRRPLSDEMVNDRVLAERVRSRLGHVVERPDAIVVHANLGDVRLSGSVGPGELANLIAAIRAVPGVEELSHELTVRAAAAAR